MSTIDPLTANFLKDLPKCEHHVHLEGTLSPDLLFKLISKHKPQLPPDFPENPQALESRYNRFANLDDFLHFYYIGMNVLVDQDDFYQLAWNYLQVASDQGVRHLEMFFDPQGHLPRGVSFDTFIKGFTKACTEAEAKLGITTKLIMCLLRHLPVENCHQTLQQSHEFFDSGHIHGLGLDSSEKPFPPELFTSCFSSIKTKYPHVGLTAHAGEEGSAQYVTNALDHLNVTRIDHGINSHFDEALMKRLAREKTLLSICPVSNKKLQVVENVGQLPLQKFLDFDVSFSINSDDPAYFNAYILDNYLEVQRHFNFSKETWGKIAKNGIRGSWIDEERRRQLEREVDEVLLRYVGE